MRGSSREERYLRHKRGSGRLYRAPLELRNRDHSAESQRTAAQPRRLAGPIRRTPRRPPLRAEGEDLVHDFSDTAIAEHLSASLEPRLRARLEGRDG